MISLDIIYALITSIIIITVSLIIFILVKRLNKIYISLITDIQSKIVEIESLNISYANNLRNVQNKINEVTQDLENLSMKFYRIEKIVLGKKTLIRREKREVEKAMEETRRIPITKLNNTEKTILKLLREGPKTTREIKGILNLSREHIARELKNLYEKELVKRHTENKPYTYELNKEKLEEINLNI